MYSIVKSKQIIITCILLIIIFFAGVTIVSCETPDNIDSNLLILRKVLVEELSLYVRQDDYKVLNKTLYYKYVILKDPFILNFVNNLDLTNIMLSCNANTTDIKDEILNRFDIYVKEEQWRYFHLHTLSENMLKALKTAADLSVMVVFAYYTTRRIHVPMVEGPTIDIQMVLLECKQLMSKNTFGVTLSFDDTTYVLISINGIPIPIPLDCFL